MAIIDELITVFSFKQGKGSKKELKQFENAISGLRKQALLAGAAFAGFGIAATKIVQGVDQQAKFAKGIGVSFESLRKFQFAAQKAGASTSELDSFMGNLARTIVSFRPGDFNNALVRLGVSARTAEGKIRPISGVILDISDEIKKLNATRRLQFASQLGGGVNIANFLGQGSKDIRKDMQTAVETGFVIPEKLTGQFAEFFDDSLLRLRSTIQGFSEVLIGTLLPSIIKVVDNLETWILKNRELLSTDIAGFLKGAGLAFEFFGNAISFVFKGISSIISPLVGVNKELGIAKGLGFAVASAVIGLAAAATFAAGEWVLLGAAISAVIALIPKMDGLMESIESKSKFLRDVRDAFNSINPLSSGGQVNAAKGLFSLIPSIDDIGSGLDRITGASGSSAITPQGISNNSADKNVTLNNTFNISGAVDAAKETARNITRELETALQSASPGFNRPKVG